PPRFPLFPYTTLFRSRSAALVVEAELGEELDILQTKRLQRMPDDRKGDRQRVHEECSGDPQDGPQDRQNAGDPEAEVGGEVGHRSEEHTSELQSRENI